MQQNFLDTITDQSICTIKVTFWDNTNAPFTIHGTAFWIRNNNEIMLATNKHNFVPGMKDPNRKNYRVTNIAVQLRAREENKFTEKTKFFKINLTGLKGLTHDSADVALLIKPSVTEGLGSFSCTPIRFDTTTFADNDFFLNTIRILDPVALIGYPDDWYDKIWKSAVARICNIASNPLRSFNHELVNVTDLIQVTGLSFGGNSGSPVIFLEKGIRGVTIGEFKYVPPRVIGIMTGHFDLVSQEKKDKIYSNSGVAYFTKSTCIFELLSGEKATPINGYIADKSVIEKYETLPKI